MAIKELSDKNPDGTRLGQAVADLVGFFGATPVSQPKATNQAAPSATAATNGTPFGFTTSTQANALVNCVIEMRAALVNLGLIKGSF
jgi:hypothetical protein